jgi:hypothetical protein
MSEYVAEGILPVIPDDLTVPQFILDSSHSTRPIRKEAIPWLVDDTTGHQIGFEEVSDRLMNVKPWMWNDRCVIDIRQLRSAVVSLDWPMLSVLS